MASAIYVGIMAALIVVVWFGGRRSGRKEKELDFRKSADKLVKKQNEKLRKICKSYTGKHRPESVLSGKPTHTGIRATTEVSRSHRVESR